MKSEILLSLTITAIFGFSQAAPPDVATIALLKFREKCVNISGSDEGFYQLFGSLKPAQTCILEHLKEVYQQGLPTIDDYEARQDFFTMVRPTFNEAVDCLDDVFEGAAKCSTEAHDKLVPILKDVMYGLVELICRNGGELFFDIQTSEFRTCFKMVKENAIHCKASEATRTITNSAFTLDQCREVAESRDCFKDICDIRAMDDIIDKVFDTLMNATKCENVLY